MKSSSRTKFVPVTPNEIQPVTIRYARETDVAGAKDLADRHRVELGFIREAVLREAQQKKWLLVAVQDEQVVGFANFRIRQDKNATLYDIVIDEPYRKQKIGKRLVQRLTWLVNIAGGEHIRLKCPQSLPANAFYEKLQFTRTGTEIGKKRHLNVWHYFLKPLPRRFEFHEDVDGFLHSPPKHSPHFFASATIAPGEIRKIYELWHTHAHDFEWPRGKPNPFQRLLISPVLASPSTLAFVRELKRSGETEEVMFDSGGFFVQKGDITYNRLYSKLREVYHTEDWADIYILPDNPPLSKDSMSDAEDKIRQTVDGIVSFAYQLPIEIRKNVMPVIHAKQAAHLEYCLQNYEPLMADSHRIGFGSFPTMGATNSINRVNADVLRLLDDLVPRLNGSRLHSFGISTPPAVFCLAKVGVETFDSNGWMRSGGYGKIFFPFTFGRMVDCKARGYVRVHSDELEPIKLDTGHRCPFCESFNDISDGSGRWHRIMHNLTVMTELEVYHRKPQWEILKEHSGNYYRMLKAASVPVFGEK
ncbi:GNAT family N-acetyltransferase [Candidatus Poribacteria bacterium]|nr:GNAT family N-acetyltransferase [Candidatus Poribacteria bacterium]MYK94411.1 GNAT family N-acetyltransferase [Candidatus Poribacteria bacterium]